MRPKYRIKNILQFIAFAFYPKSTMIACTACSIVGIIVLAIAMMMVPSDSRLYNVIFALTTGVTGSFFVSIVVELSGNYRNNKLAWQELQDYYSIVDEYETMKQVYMENTPSQRAEKKARNEFVDSIFQSDVGTELTDEIMEELKNIAEEHPKDIIESTWEQLPKIIPVLRRTFDEKKAFLNDDEIFALRIIIDNYLQIRHEVMELLQMSPMLYDILNSPDQEFLNYPKNIFENLPKWMKKCLASNEGQNAMERLTDSVMSDKFMLSYFMNDYEISVRGLDEYHSVLGDESDNEECDDYDLYEPEDPAEHRAYHIKMDKKLIKENRPFVSWHISHCCLEISENIDILEKNILKKPYYGFHLKYNRDAFRHKTDNPLTDISYKSEMKRLEELLKGQEND